MSFKPCGLVSLTTDFGLRDPFVGTLHGVIAAREPGVRIIDLCHAIGPQDVTAAGFWLGRAFQYFPPGTVHLAVVDPGVGTDRELLLVTASQHCFLAPDNGLLADICRLGDAEIRRVFATTLASVALKPCSRTFHGRDLFAPLAAVLAAGKLDPRACGELVTDPVPGRLAELILSPGQTQGRVVVVDHFGNLITNLEAAILGDRQGLEVWVGEYCLPLCSSYSEVGPGEACALINAWGLLEIACRNANAARQLGVTVGGIVQVLRS